MNRRNESPLFLWKQVQKYDVEDAVRTKHAGPFKVWTNSSTPHMTERLTANLSKTKHPEYVGIHAILEGLLLQNSDFPGFL